MLIANCINKYFLYNKYKNLENQNINNVLIEICSSFNNSVYGSTITNSSLVESYYGAIRTARISVDIFTIDELVVYLLGAKVVLLVRRTSSLLLSLRLLVNATVSK